MSCITFVLTNRGLFTMWAAAMRKRRQGTGERMGWPRGAHCRERREAQHTVPGKVDNDVWVLATWVDRIRDRDS
jgi:hypothetical protein